MFTNTNSNLSNRYFILYPNNIPIWGKEQSIIVDLNLGEYYKIPNIVLEILQKSRDERITVKEICNCYDHFNEEDVLGVLNQFVQAGIGLYSSKYDLIKQLDFRYNTPFAISNAIIELINLENYCLFSLLNSLNNMNCQQIEIRIINNMILNEVINIIEKFENSIFRSIQVVLLSSKNISNFGFELIEKNRKIYDAFIFDSKGCDTTIGNRFSKIKHINKVYDEQLEDVSFIINSSYFYEAQSYNASLHQKLSIDKNGAIKNHLAHKKIFGNINNEIIKDVAARKDFQFLWFIANDSIEICKECELRYFCLSFSDIVEDDGIFVKKNYCNRIL